MKNGDIVYHFRENCVWENHDTKHNGPSQTINHFEPIKSILKGENRRTDSDYIKWNGS